MIALRTDGLASRLAAVGLLLLVGVAVLPLLSAPFDRYREARAAQETEQAVLDAAETRLATVMTLARNAPIIRAESRDAAQAAMMQALSAAAPPAAMRILSVAGDTPAEPETARIDIAFTAEATPAGLDQFATALSGGQPPLTITSIAIAAGSIPGRDDHASPLKLSVQLVVSGLFVKEAQP
ncbi:Type II secretion system (T2SS), protein M subtype b [Rhizobium sp. RU20A]|uniref:GspMb/PilO family protein n=1 Tax=Rhizobium sp. RU20A TaxID=1907412 RepID=UPI000956BC0E|nr:GspMb/PilO family protein [Rhizobium sp. RU20A]SIQ86680.1 Type II secretion system (T2SS), protein M subtype b [Rhizobium sp. RU20A]